MRLLIKSLFAAVLLVLVYLALDRAFPSPMAHITVSLQRVAAGLTEKHIRVDDLDISYLDSGERGGETLLLIHGFGADKDNFTPAAILLRSTGRIIALDLPGFGDSSKRDDLSYSIAAQADRVVRIMDALQLQRVHLGGSSMGGALALEIARRDPQRVRSLWLLAPAGVAGAKPSEMMLGYRKAGRSALVAQNTQDYDALLDIVMSRPPPMPYSLRHELAAAAIENSALHARIFHELHATMPAMEQQAAGLAVPTLLVWGEQDRVLDVSGAELLQRALPQSTLIRLAKIGHLPMLEDPLLTTRDYRQFRTRLAGTGS